MPRQRHGFGHSQTPSTDECPLDPTLARRISNAGPPPSRGFATPGTASDAPSLPRPVKGRGLDQAASPRAHRSGAFEATRRSSTSANETIRKHDHRTIDTRPLTRAPTRLSPRRRPLSGPVRGGALLHLRLTGAARGPRSRGLSGQGPFDVDLRSRAPRQAPSSRDGSQWRLRPNPMWLGHLASRCRSPPGWSRRGDARCANEPDDIS